MANPQIPQGTLNLLLTSITLPSFPSLNVTPSQLGPGMVRLGLEGDMTRYLRVAVGVVPSPQVYQIARIAVELVKSQPIAAAYKAQWESNTLLGAATVRPDSTVFPPFDVTQVGIVDVAEMGFDGSQAAITVTLNAQYNINSSLWP